MLKLIVSPTSLDFIKECSFCDGFIVGEHQFGLRLPTYFSISELKEIVAIAHPRKQLVFLSVNKILHEPDLMPLEILFKDLLNVPFDGILFGDLAVFEIAKKFHLVDRLIYHPETYITNYQTVNFFAKKGIEACVLAKEIPLIDIELIGDKALCPVMILGHGMANMFHSYRDLITNYFHYLKDESTHHQEELYLIEEIRDEKYPIFEDEQGTHVFSAHDVCTIEYLDHFITHGISLLKIEGLFKTDQILWSIVSVYKQAITDYQQDPTLYQSKKKIYLEQLTQIEGIRAFNEGFLFKKTVYKGETNEQNR